MNSTDVFFTQTIVGPPFSVLLGRRHKVLDSDLQGLEVNMASGESRLTSAWNDWIVLSHETDTPGTTRKRPGKLRRVLERHALWVAILGMLAGASSAAYWGYMLWS